MKNFFKKIVLNIITLEAKLVLKKNKPKIIAITGNLGKTTTKDLVYSALKKNLLDKDSKSLVLASKKSMNSEFGIPLTILGLNSGWNSILSWIKIILLGFFKIFSIKKYKYLILEVGADSPDDIKNITRYIKPDVVVLTQFAEVPVHVEFFGGDRDRLVREKKYLVEALKQNGIFIFNSDDKDCKNIALDIYKEGRSDIEYKTFSFKDKDSDLFVKETNIISYEDENGVFRLDGISAILDFKKEEKEIKIEGILGEAIISSVMPALIVADLFNINIDKAIKDIETSKRTKGRMRILKGIHNTNIVDDTYNSSPKAVVHGIESINKINTKNKKIFILGDMLELGEFTREEHEKIGETLVGKCDILIATGIRSRFTAQSAIKHGMSGEYVYEATDSLDAGKIILNILDSLAEEDYRNGKTESNIGGHIIFVKGSQGARMEKVVKMILDKNTEPRNELVRQEEAWKDR